MTETAGITTPPVVAFDVDGVLVRARDENGYYWQEELARDFGIDMEEVARFFQTDWDACILGEADLDNVLPPYLERWGYEGGVHDFLRYWFAHDCRLDEDLLEAIDRLDPACRLVIATNQDRHRARYLWEDLELRRRFERMFVSSAMGARKPDHAFWHHVTSTVDPAHPGDILLIDDSETNVAAARDFGWQAIHFRDRSDLDGLLGPA